jgi:GTP-binding protein EngB required for normal cell division
MFTFESIIDTVTSAQTKFVETYITDNTAKKNLVKLLDSQATLTKTTYNNTLELAQTAFKNFNELVYSKKAGA